MLLKNIFKVNYTALMLEQDLMDYYIMASHYFFCSNATVVSSVVAGTKSLATKCALFKGLCTMSSAKFVKHYSQS